MNPNLLEPPPESRTDDDLVRTLERPHPRLLLYYFLRSCLTGPLLPIVFLPQFFRYQTMRYTFDEDGVSMRWGILFRKEISLAYARLQDIHLASNLLERWLGLGRVQLQTASGSAGAEMTIEGLQEFETVRDVLYERMRDARGGARTQPSREPATSSLADAVEALREATAELRAIRETLQATGDRPGPEPEEPSS